MKRLNIGIAVAALSLGIAQAQNPNLGTSGAQFLKIPVGARATALGGAFTSVGNDAGSIFWNPSGIVGVANGEFCVSHTEWWAGSRLNHAAFVRSFGEVGTFGLSFTSLSMDKIEVTTEDQPEGTGQTYDAQDLMIGITYARTLIQDFSAGITVKYVHQRIWNETASGPAVDIGTQYHIGYRDLTLGMSITNFGGDLAFSGRDLNIDYSQNALNSTERLLPSALQPEEYPLPLHFQVGLSMSPYQSDDFSVRLATDVIHPNDNKEVVAAGLEISIMQGFFLRGGYRFGDDTARESFGMGASIPTGDVRVNFDYAFVANTILPSVHRFSLGIGF